MIWDICQLQPVFLAGAHSWLNIGQGLYPNVDSAYLPPSLLCSLLVLSLSTEHQLCTHISSISFFCFYPKSSRRCPKNISLGSFSLGSERTHTHCTFFSFLAYPWGNNFRTSSLDDDKPFNALRVGLTAEVKECFSVWAGRNLRDKQSCLYGWLNCRLETLLHSLSPRIDTISPHRFTDKGTEAQRG